MHYLITSPEMFKVVPILDDGSGPTEYFRCCVFIEAENTKDAKTFALKTKEFEPWVDERRSDQLNPFTGLDIEVALCPHGFCWCVGCMNDEGHPKCDICIREFEEEAERQQLLESAA